MTKSLLICCACLLALAACVPTQALTPSETLTPQPPTPSSTETSPAPTPTATAAGAATVEMLLWVTDAQTKIVIATFCCGLVPQQVRLNYLPAAQIWGDGRILWTQIAPGGKRQVLEGQLTREQLGNLLNDALSQGFMEWDERYIGPNAPTDLPSKCLTIQTAQHTRRVCEYYQGAPPAFHTLYDAISGGAGVAGTPYAPVKAYLTASLSPPPLQDAATTALAWDANALGLSLAQAVAGIWLEEGPALQRAWEAVSGNAWQPLVKQDDEFYILTLQIPGVSMTEPPAP